MNTGIDVAILGATGVVGSAFLSILAERNFPIRHLYPLASRRSAGQTILFKGQTLTVLDVAEFDFSKVQLGLFSAGGSVSAEYAPKAALQGCIVIDNTSHFRYDADVPLVVAEVNPHAIAGYKKRGIIANPNCSTMQMLVALKPLHDAACITRINVATYQSVSGTGKQAIDELIEQTRHVLANEPVVPSVYPRQIAFNVLPHIDVFLSNGYTKEEMKMVWETQKIFEMPDLFVNPTAVRVPVFYGHSEALHIETKIKLSAAQARALLENAQGIVLMDEAVAGGYPTALDSAGTDPVYVGRIREDVSHPNGLNLWVVSDNIRKGAALNAVQIAEILVRDHHLIKK